MPTAKKLPSGNWRVQVYDGTDYIDGKPKKIMKSFTAPTKKEAEYKASLYSLKNKNIKNTAMTNITLNDVINIYIDSKDGILSPSTILGYKQIQRTYLKNLQKEKLLNITNLKIQIAINQDGKLYNLSPKTMRNISALISASICSYNEDFKYNVTLPQKERYEYYLPNANEILNILNYLECENDIPLRIAVLISAYLGLRRGEICALNWEDFDFKNKVVKINKSKVLTENNDWKIKKPKTYSGFRSLSISDGLIKELQKVSSTGQVISISPSQISVRFSRVLKKLELQHFRFHDLRHFNASVMMSEGIPDKYAMERMGHSTTHMLKNVYQHTEAEKMKDINTNLNRLLDTVLIKRSHESSHEK